MSEQTKDAYTVECDNGGCLRCGRCRPLTGRSRAMEKFCVGDPVCRREDVFDEQSRMMTGIVIGRYADHASRFGPYPELYAVRWDDGTERRGYLPHGLSAADGKA